jgi:hypothetical protein
MTMWMNLEDILLRKISQARKYKYCMVSLIYGILKKKKKKAKSPRQKIERWVSRAGGKALGRKREILVKVSVRKISIEDVLYSMVTVNNILHI